MSNSFTLLTNFDLLGVEPLFFINEKVRFKSISGSIQILILFIILLILISIEINKYINTTNPQSLEVIELYPEYQTILNKSNFFLAYSFSFQDLKKKFEVFPSFNLDEYIKSSVVIHYGKYEYRIFKNDVSNSSIVNCTNFNLEEFEISNYTKNELINTTFCIDLNNSIMNISEDNGYSTLEISVYLNNSYFDEYLITHRINKSQMYEMEEILSNYNFHLNMYYQTILSSPSEYTKVANKKKINKEKREFNLFDYNMLYIFSIKKFTSMKKLDFLRKGKYYKNITYFNSINTDAISPYTEYYYEGVRKFITYTYTLDNTHTIQILKYPTFSEIFSEIGGTFNIIFNLLKIIFRWFQRFEEIHYLSHKCFSNKILSKKTNKSRKDVIKPFSTKIFENKDVKNNSYNLNNNLNASFNNHSQNLLVNHNKISSNINLNSNISNIGNYQKNVSDNKLIVINKSQSENNIRQILQKQKLILVKDKELDFNQYIFEKNKRKEYNWKKEICYFFCNECKESKSFFINSFKTFLSIENIMRWNQEWVAFKIAELDSLEQIAMKYIDIDKIKGENYLYPYEKNDEELSELIKKINEKKNSAKRYGNLEKLLL